MHDIDLTVTVEFVGLVFAWLVRRLQHEGVTFTFDPHGRSTEVRVAESFATAPTPSLPRPSVVTRLV
jgi:hypothetical protein